MELTVTIDIPEKDIRDAIHNYGEQAFSKPMFTNGNVGWRLVKEQVDRYINTLDLSEMIAYQLTPIVNRVVNEVIAGEVGKHVRGIVYRELKKKTAAELKSHE